MANDKSVFFDEENGILYHYVVQGARLACDNCLESFTKKNGPKLVVKSHGHDRINGKLVGTERDRLPGCIEPFSSCSGKGAGAANALRAGNYKAYSAAAVSGVTNGVCRPQISNDWIENKEDVLTKSFERLICDEQDPFNGSRCYCERGKAFIYVVTSGQGVDEVDWVSQLTMDEILALIQMEDKETMALLEKHRDVVKSTLAKGIVKENAAARTEKDWGVATVDEHSANKLAENYLTLAFALAKQPKNEDGGASYYSLGEKTIAQVNQFYESIIPEEAEKAIERNWIQMEKDIPGFQRPTSGGVSLSQDALIYQLTNRMAPNSLGKNLLMAGGVIVFFAGGLSLPLWGPVAVGVVTTTAAKIGASIAAFKIYAGAKIASFALAVQLWLSTPQGQEMARDIVESVFESDSIAELPLSLFTNIILERILTGEITPKQAKEMLGDALDELSPQHKKAAVEAIEDAADFGRMQTKDAVGEQVEQGVKQAINGIGNTVVANSGRILDTTPSKNHSTTTKNPGYKGTSNSSIDILDDAGNVSIRRWFGEDGKAVRDVDMTNHGNAKTHPEWPHEHIWEYGEDGKPTGR